MSRSGWVQLSHLLFRLRWLSAALAVCVIAVIPGPAHSAEAAAASKVVVRGLSVNHRGDPLGVPVEAPVLSWQLDGAARGILQSAWQVQMTTSADGFGSPNVWDSGRVTGRDSVNVRYTGPPLKGHTRYFWRVRVWDGRGAISGWSAPAWFETALPAQDTKASDWGAKWIGGPPNQPRGLDWSDYTLTVRTSDVKEALGIVFYADSAAAGNTYMWQLSERGHPSLHPHIRVNGDWTDMGGVDIPDDVLPGGFAAEHTISIALSSGTAATSIDGHPVDSRPIPARSAGTVGFRIGAGESGIVHEVTVAKGSTTMFHTDFSDGVDPFEIGTVTPNGLSISGAASLGVFRVPSLPLPMLRKDFSIGKRVASARLYSTALGVYRVEMNGRRAGNDELAPGWTDYSRLVQYQVHDVTGFLHKGANTIGAEIAPGWYAGNIAWFGPGHWGTNPAFLGRLDIVYADGSKETIGTDESWVWQRGPVLSADLLMGETYDARREIPGWSEPGSTTGWAPVHVYEPAVGDLHAQTDPPVQVTGRRATAKVTRPASGVTIYDMGQNMVGWARARLTGKAGDVVRIRHGEVLNPDGTLYTANLRTAKATETVTLGADGTTEFSPRFTIHGFRYVEITGLAQPPAAADVTGIVVGTGNPLTSTFDTSDAMLNRLQQNVVWGIRGNFVSVPTDTPARDERLGYSGDLNVIADTATFNTNSDAFLSKWLRDMRLRQAPNGILPEFAPGIDPGVGENVATAGWGDGHLSVVHALWKQYGDTQVIDENWEAMVKYVGFWTSVAQDDIVPDGHAIGDWLNIDDPTPDTLLATAYYAHDARLLSELASATGRTSEAAHYSALADRIAAAYAKRFIKSDGTVSTGSQAAYAISLGMDLVPADLRDAVSKKLVAAIDARGGHLSTGFLGTPYLLPALSSTGHDDVAYRLLTEKTYPSWLYEVAKGATTMWERWDSIKPDGSFENPAMNSFNHYAYGAVGAWMYSSIGGIRAIGPGYSTFEVAPRPGGGLTHATVTHASPYGTIRSSWHVDGHRIMLDVTVPANTTATVRVPAINDAVTESGKDAGHADGVRFVRRDGNVAVYSVGSGNYHFTAEGGRA